MRTFWGAIFGNGLFDLVQKGGETGGICVSAYTGDDGLLSKHDRGPIGVRRSTALNVLECGSEIDCDKIREFCTAHTPGRSRHDKFLLIHIDDAVFDNNTAAAHFRQLLCVIVTP